MNYFSNLVKEVDIRKHLIHFYKVDPNRLIYNELSRIHGLEYAEKFKDYRIIWERVKKTKELLPYPLTLVFSLINACNLKCAHCYRQYNPNIEQKNVLEWEEIKRAIDQCKGLGVPAIIFGSSAELFMHKDALRAIEYASKKGIMDIFVATNGILLNPNIINKLFELKITRLTVSLDAFTEKTYRKVRGDGYEKVMSNIRYFLWQRKKLKQHLPILRVTFTKFNLNKNEAYIFSKYWRRKADLVDIQHFIDVKNVNTLKYRAVDRIDCHYPWTTLHIKWDGSYRPCCTEFCNYLKIGSIDKETMGEVWRSEKMEDLRRCILDKNAFPAACINCMRSLKSKERYSPVKD